MSDISIIVPTRNRAAALAVTLESVAAVVPPNAPVEILVVDNGSTDKTVHAFNAVSTKFSDCTWRYFYEPMPGLLSGRHKGAAEAKGEVLSFLDDDVLLAPSWLDALQEAFADPSVALVGGPSTPHFEVDPPAWLDGLWVDADDGRRLGQLSLIDCGRSIKAADPLYVWGLNFSVRRSVFESCRGFHPDCTPRALQRYQGDGETGLTLRIKASGLRALYHPNAALRHVIPRSRLTPESFEQRGFYQGVCDSFTRIRRERQVDSIERRSWKESFRPLKRTLHRAYLLARADPVAVRELSARAYVNGFQFHQNEVHNDARLLDWVLKPDYFDYRLPAGWQQYVR
jgi:glycosyltransferase involved in cell wall biosynthesis